MQKMRPLQPVEIIELAMENSKMTAQQMLTFLNMEADAPDELATVRNAEDLEGIINYLWVQATDNLEIWGQNPTMPPEEIGDYELMLLVTDGARLVQEAQESEEDED